MSSADEVQVVLAEEVGDHVGAEGAGDAPLVVGRPSSDAGVGVGPEQVAEQAGVGHVGGPGQVPDLVEAAQVRGDAAVNAEDAVVDEGGGGEAVEAVGEEAPEADAVAALALVVEAVDAVDGGALVVAAEEEEMLRVPELVRQQQADGLDAVIPAVHVVAQEQVLAPRRETAALENPQQVTVLTVHVTADVNGRVELQEVWLPHEHVLGRSAELPDLRLGKLHHNPLLLLLLLPRTAPPRIHKATDHIV
uniref:TOPP4 n=1 Tax=Arundo donax TaxID=35708 RepID=A0A0A8YB81_ARUDO